MSNNPQNKEYPFKAYNLSLREHLRNVCHIFKCCSVKWDHNKRVMLYRAVSPQILKEKKEPVLVPSTHCTASAMLLYLDLFMHCGAARYVISQREKKRACSLAPGM